MKLHKTLYFKYIIFTLAIMLFSGILALLATNAYYHRVLKQQNDTKNIAIATDMTWYIENNHVEDLPAYLRTIANVGYQLYVVNEQGQGDFYGSAYRLKEIDQHITDTVLAGNTYHGMRDYPRQLFITGFFANDLENTVGVPFTYKGERYALFARPDIRLLFSEMHVVIGSMMLVSLLASLLSIVIAAWYLIKPIRVLTEATKQIAREQYDIAVPITRSDEIGSLAQSFNKMAVELKHQDETRKSFIRNISHDFQTPLQNINGYANLLKNSELSSNDKQQYAQIIEAETRRLSNLTKQLLLLNSIDHLAHKKEHQKVNITAQIEQIIAKNGWQIEKKELAVWLELDQVEFYGDETLLENVWENCIGNAIKYNKQGGEIAITLKNEAHQIRVTITDKGIGMEAHHLSEVFKRFYRVDEARQTPGTGLGLAIVQEVVHFYDGEIVMDSAPNVGTTLHITLPKK